MFYGGVRNPPLKVAAESRWMTPASRRGESWRARHSTLAGRPENT
jgi:hypothetical protein